MIMNKISDNDLDPQRLRSSDVVTQAGTESQAPVVPPCSLDFFLFAIPLIVKDFDWEETNSKYLEWELGKELVKKWNLWAVMNKFPRIDDEWTHVKLARHLGICRG